MKHIKGLAGFSCERKKERKIRNGLEKMVLGILYM